MAALCLVPNSFAISLSSANGNTHAAAAILFPVLTMFITENYIVPGDYRIFGILLGLFVCCNHRTNIKRLLTGTESKIF